MYYDTQGQAIDQAIESATQRGFSVQIPERIWIEPVNYLQSRRYVLDLKKGDKEQRKALVIILYRMDSGKYELTSYVN